MPERFSENWCSSRSCPLIGQPTKTHPMDLGISGRHALICASSSGLGLACALSLAREGVKVTINGRGEDRLAVAAARIHAEIPSSEVHAVAADITSAQGRLQLLEACAEVDILVNNNAGPAPGQLSDWGYESLISSYEANMIPPALPISTLIPGMRHRRFAGIVNITSAMVKAPIP